MNDVGKTLRYGPGRAERRARLAPLLGWLALGLLMGLAACTAGPAPPAPGFFMHVETSNGRCDGHEDAPSRPDLAAGRVDRLARYGWPPLR